MDALTFRKIAKIFPKEYQRKILTEGSHIGKGTMKVNPA